MTGKELEWLPVHCSSLHFVSGNASEVLKEWTVTGKKKVTLFKYTLLRHLSFYSEDLD